MPVVNVSKKGLIVGSTFNNQADARDDDSGTHNDATGSESLAIQWFRSAGRGGGTMRYIRTFLYFNTSFITSTVSSCTLQIASGYNTTSADVIGVKSTAFGGDGGTDLADDDFNNVDFSTAYTTVNTSWSTSGNNLTLTSTALTDMKNNDYFIIALVEHGSDYPDSDTSDGAFSAGIAFGSSIRLNYTLAPAGYSHEVSGVAAANIGKVKGVATASIGKVIRVD